MPLPLLANLAKRDLDSQASPHFSACMVGQDEDAMQSLAGIRCPGPLTKFGTVSRPKVFHSWIHRRIKSIFAKPLSVGIDPQIQSFG